MEPEKFSILVIDDDSISNFVTVRHLKQFSSLESVKDFTDPVEALHYLQTKHQANEVLPDFILLDINMPNLDGWTFLDQLQDFQILKPKVYMLTSSIYPEDFERSKEFKLVNGFIVKPLDKKKIQSQLKID